VQGAYTQNNQGWYLAQATNGSGQTINLAAIGDSTNGYPGDCSNGNNANNPEVIFFGAFNFSNAGSQHTATFNAYYDSQGTDGAIFFVYDVTTGATDFPNPIAGQYDYPLASGTGGVLAGNNSQTMTFDLSSYSGKTDPYMVGLMFQSNDGSSALVPGYFAFGPVEVQ
jgi:hypothetical protein